MMQRYVNQSEKSGVRAYEIGDRSIAVEFEGGDVYLYTYGSAGRMRVETMKRLAKAGKGLSTYISQSVRNRFAQKFRDSETQSD
jgi:hypothetical protein